MSRFYRRPDFHVSSLTGFMYTHVNTDEMHVSINQYSLCFIHCLLTLYGSVQCDNMCMIVLLY